MSTNSSPPRRAASVPPPVHPSMRKRRAREDSEISDPAPTKKVRTKKQLDGDQSSPALSGFKIPRQFEALRHEAPERGLTPEFEQIDNDAAVVDKEIPDSSSTGRYINISRSPSQECDNEERYFSAGSSVTDEEASDAKFASPEPESKAEDIWNIDGLDIRAVLAKGPFNKTKFSRKQDSKILLWMKVNETRGLTGHAESFKQLLIDLGFSGKGHTKDVENILKVKVKGRIHSWYAALKKKGIVEDVEVDENIKGVEALKVKFADYTDSWSKEDWDGDIEVPTSWLLNTVEVDREEFSDEEPEVLLVERNPSPKKGKAKNKQKKNKNAVPACVELPMPRDIFSAIHEYYSNLIRKAKDEDNAKKPVELLDRKTLNQNQWNFAAVQAQHAAIPIKAKLEKFTIEVSEDEDEDEDTDEDPDSDSDDGNEEEKDAEHGGMIPIHQYASMNNEQKVPDQETYISVGPDTLYAKVDSEHSTPQNPGASNLDAASQMNKTPQTPCNDIANYTEESPSKLTFGSSISSLTNNTHPDLEHIDITTDIDGDELMSNYADEEDNARTPSPPQLTHPNTCLLPTCTQYHCPTCHSHSHNALLNIPYKIYNLSTTTYGPWKRQLRCILVLNNTWGILTGAIKPPVPFMVDKEGKKEAKGFFGGDEEFEARRGAFERERREWEEMVEGVRKWMVGTMGEEMRGLVEREGWGIGGGVERGDVRGLWRMLRWRFEGVDVDEEVDVQEEEEW